MCVYVYVSVQSDRATIFTIRACVCIPRPSRQKAKIKQRRARDEKRGGVGERVRAREDIIGANVSESASGCNFHFGVGTKGHAARVCE